MSSGDSNWKAICRIEDPEFCFVIFLRAVRGGRGAGLQITQKTRAPPVAIYQGVSQGAENIYMVANSFVRHRGTAAPSIW